MNRLLRLAALTSIALGLLGTAPTSAAEVDQDWFRAVGPRDWLINYDSTLIGRRVYSQTSYESDRNGDYTLEIATSARYAFSPVDGLALGAQFELPVKWERNNGVTAAGLTAFEWRAGWVVRLAKPLRWGAGMNLKVPTWVGAELGSPWTELRPITALSWDVRDWLNLGLFTSYYLTPANTSASGTNKIELQWPVSIRLSDSWSAVVTYKPTFFPALEDVTHRLQFGATYLFGSKREFSIFPAFEVPLGEQNRKSDLAWKAYLSLSWAF